MLIRSLFQTLIILFSALTAVAQTRVDCFIPLSTNDSLDATYFIPTTAPPLNGYPVMLLVHGFGENKDLYTATCSSNARRGYMGITYSVRGHGNSSGLSTIMSQQERFDLATVLNFIRVLPNIDTNLIGLRGSSQGGLHGLWACADNLPIKAISSDVIVPNWATDLLMNGTFRRTLLLLLKSSRVRYPSERDTLWQLIKDDNYAVFKERFVPPRDADTTLIRNSTIPMVTFIKWQDHYFSAQDGIVSFLNQTSNKKLYLGTVGHISDASVTESAYQWDIISKWFQYFIFNEPNGILAEPPITYASSSLPMDSAGNLNWNRTEVSYWPPAGIELTKLYLGQNSQLLLTPSNAESDSVVLLNQYLDTTYTFEMGFIEGFNTSRFNSTIPKHTLVWESVPITNEVYWVGESRMNLFLRSDFLKFPINVQVYEVDNNGIKYFINRINFIARGWQAGESGMVDIKGIAHSHKFSVGSKIRIEITNIDKTNRTLWGQYPFVAPLFYSTNVTIYNEKYHPSYIELPLIGKLVSVLSENRSQDPSRHTLNNYPNPFNPVTIIEYSLPVAENISIKIYDVLGREVKTLFDGRQSAGQYRHQFDGSKLASGVYFYKLQSSSFSAVKKMLLLR